MVASGGRAGGRAGLGWAGSRDPEGEGLEGGHSTRQQDGTRHGGGSVGGMGIFGNTFSLQKQERKALERNPYSVPEY